jgi:hypothetical protein
MTTNERYTVAAVVATAAISSARADMGVPMIALFLPPMWVALVPIIVVESFIIYRVVRVPFRRALLALTAANVVSTLVGVPIAWFVLAIGEMVCCGGAIGLSTPLAKIYAVTLQAPWLIPYESDLGWMIPIALVTLAIVFAALSIVVETPIAARILRLPPRSMWRGMAWANVGSYVLLGILGGAAANSGAKLDALYRPFEPLSVALIEGVARVASAIAK